jgi:predicted PurR-regulated permease PerM
MSTAPDDLRPFIARLLVAGAIFGLIYLAWHLRGLLLLAMGAAMVAVILRLVADPFHRRLPIGPGAALGIAVLLLAAGLGVAFWLFGAEVVRQTESLSKTLPVAWASLMGRLDAWGIGDPVRQFTSGSGGGTLSGLGRFAASVGSGIADTLLVIVGGIYLAAQPRLYRAGIIKLVPEGRRGPVADALDECGGTLALWLKGRLVSMAVVGVLTTTGLWLIGVPSALSLGLLSALLEFIPFIGPIISAVPAILLALAHDPQAALWTALLYLVVQQLEGNVIEPLVQQRAVTIPPALLLFSLVGAGLVFGIAGIVLGAPLTVVLYALVKRLYVREALGTDTPLPTEEAKEDKREKDRSASGGG